MRRENLQSISLMPSADEMYRLLKYLDITYKAEMVLYQMHSLVFWTSMMEIIMFFLLFICFCAGVGSAGGLGGICCTSSTYQGACSA